MRSHYVFLLALGVIYANAEVDSVAKDPTSSTSTLRHPLLAEKDDTSAPRFGTAPEEEEERGHIVDLIISLFKSNVPKQIAKWKAEGKTMEDIYMTLRLDKKGNKILDDPKFLHWAEHADDEILLSKVSTLYHDDDALLAKVLEEYIKTAKSDELKRFVTRLQKLQENKLLLQENKLLLSLNNPETLAIWMHQVANYKPLDDKPEVVLGRLLTVFRDPAEMFKNLLASNDFHVLHLAKRLRLEYLKTLAQKQFTIKQVAENLKLQESTDLDSLYLRVWAEYMQTLLRLHRNTGQTPTLSKIIESYRVMSEELIAAAKENKVEGVLGKLTSILVHPGFRGDVDPAVMKKILQVKPSSPTESLERQLYREYELLAKRQTAPFSQ